MIARYKLFPCLLTLFLLAAALPAWAQTPDELAARVQKAYEPVKNFTAAYTRVSSFVAMAGSPSRVVKATGVISWARPLMLRLDQDSPKAEEVISNGKLAWWVRPGQKRVDLYSVATFAEGLRSITDAIGGLAKIDQAFNVAAPTPAENKAGAGDKTLALLPKVARADIKRLVLWFNPKTLIISGFQMENLVGDLTSYRFGGVAVNQSLAQDQFAYQIPEGWRLVDHRPIRRE